MTAREKKAVEIYRELGFDTRLSDEEILSIYTTQCILKGMQWQAEQCAKEHSEVFDGTTEEQDVIRNAGTEEVQP